VAKAVPEEEMPKKPDLSEEDVELRRTFGERLKEAREAMKKSPAEVAAIGGISLAHQYRIEAGERTADVLYLQKLIARFGSMFASLVLDVDLGQASKPPSRIGLTQSNTGAGAVLIGHAGGSVAVKTRR
jgi:transcriptional regulator with XRE-family HTH domain